MNSIRGKLIVGLLAGLGLLLAVGGATLYLAVRTVLLQEFDAVLRARAQALATLTKQEGERIELEFAEELMPEFESGERPAYFEVWRPDGRLLERSPSLRGSDLPQYAGEMGMPLFWDLPLPGGRRGRAIGMAFLPQIEDETTAPDEAEPSSLPARLVIAVERTQLDRQLRMIAAATAGASVLMMAGAAALAVIVIHRALRPLAELARSVGEIEASTLSSRFAGERLPAELKPIYHRLNELLSRLQNAFERERHFSADVAHELRTPVAELRALAEVAMRWPSGHADSQHAFADALAIAEQMETVVSGLLLMARCEGGLETVCCEVIALEPLVREVWGPVARQAERKGIAVHFELPQGVSIESDRTLLRIILGNLLANAAEHGSEGGEIAVSAKAVGGAIHVRIANSVADLAAADLPHIFERFWRKSTSRTSSHRAGLGLSIAQSAARLLGAQLAADVPKTGTFAITLTLPGAFPSP